MYEQLSIEVYVHAWSDVAQDHANRKAYLNQPSTQCYEPK